MVNKLNYLLKNYKNFDLSASDLLKEIKKSYSMFYKFKKLIIFYEKGKLNNYQLLLNYFILLHRDFNLKFVIRNLKKIGVNKKYIATLYYFFKLDIKNNIDFEFLEKLEGNSFYNEKNRNKNILK